VAIQNQRGDAKRCLRQPAGPELKGDILIERHGGSIGYRNRRPDVRKSRRAAGWTGQLAGYLVRHGRLIECERVRTTVEDGLEARRLNGAAYRRSGCAHPEKVHSALEHGDGNRGENDANSHRQHKLNGGETACAIILSFTLLNASIIEHYKSNSVLTDRSSVAVADVSQTADSKVVATWPSATAPLVGWTMGEFVTITGSRGKHRLVESCEFRL